MRTYKIGGVRRDRQEGREHIILADLFDEDGVLVLSGTLERVIELCEERRYSTTNLEPAKAALLKMKG